MGVAAATRQFRIGRLEHLHGITKWSRYAIQLRDDPQDISQPLINDSCAAQSGGDWKTQRDNMNAETGARGPSPRPVVHRYP